MVSIHSQARHTRIKKEGDSCGAAACRHIFPHGENYMTRRSSSFHPNSSEIGLGLSNLFITAIEIRVHLALDKVCCVNLKNFWHFLGVKILFPGQLISAFPWNFSDALPRNGVVTDEAKPSTFAAGFLRADEQTGRSNPFLYFLGEFLAMPVLRNLLQRLKVSLHLAAGYRSVETCRWKFAVIVLIRETQKRAGLQHILIYSDPCLELSEVESMLKEEMSKPKPLYEGCICCNLEQQMKMIAERCTRHSEEYLTKVSGLRSANLRHLSGSVMVERLTTYSMSLCDIHIRYSIVQFYCRDWCLYTYVFFDCLKTKRTWNSQEQPKPSN